MHRFTILQVEDEETDVVLLREAFTRAGIKNEVKVVFDGQKAIDYLGGHGEFANREKYPVPGLIILDLKLPRKPGFEALVWIRAHRPFDIIPVIVFSSSTLPADVEAAYRLGANAYVTKPTDIESLTDFARSLRDFWLVRNEPPPLEAEIDPVYPCKRSLSREVEPGAKPDHAPAHRP